MSRARLAAAVLLCALAGAGCTSSTTPQPNRTGSAPVVAGKSISGPVSAGATNTGPTNTGPTSTGPTGPLSPTTPSHTTTPSTTTSTSPATSPVRTTPTPDPATACVIAAVRITSIIGGAYQGHEIAALIVTNVSGQPCALRGYPSVQLRYKNRALGRPGVAPSGAPPVFVLGKGASAQAQLTAVSTCQAPESDHARVALPAAPTTVDVAVELRGCGLAIGPFQST